MSKETFVGDDRKAIENELARWRSWTNKGSKSWSCVYHLSFGFAAVLGVIVAVISSQKSLGNDYHDLLIAALSGLAAVLTTIGGFGGFERKWRTNRATRAALDIISFDLSDPTADIVDIRKRLKAAIEAHEASIMGGDRPVAQMATPG